MIVVSINRIRACKKLVLYFRFLETAAIQISESRGQFEILPESSQTSSLNLAFSSDYLDIKEIRDFGARIKHYFQNSPAFYHQLASMILVDPELKKHCEAVKLQKCPMKDLAEYYISYMDRMGKEADPKVKDKLQKGMYSNSINAAPCPFNGGLGGMGPSFPMGPGAGGHSFGGGFGPQGGQGGFQMNGGAGAGFGTPGHPFGGQGPQSFGNAPQGGYGGNNPFGGPAPGGPTGGFGGGMGGGYGAPPQGGAPGGFGGMGVGYGAGFQPHTPFGGGQPQDNPFATQPQQNDYAKPLAPQGGANQYGANPFQQNAPYTPPQMTGGEPSSIRNTDVNFNHKFDDVFSDPQNIKNGSFGGDKKPASGAGGSGDTTDDFLKQLEDLKKL